ncbi:AarF/UbiB family protein [Evansella cellulosilytica]|uniref:ABC-1 domain-containing protein n=1 Tax=Evansella cellulosilytica (strain ATCC 21833 / DSM 2522 / FERM P-1141 / JCM 9156 / N-4) TaxID=649639 RepID=E6TYG3_EVAC2|nr:AarF/UbiB family protein [Evansella cellulosilytica]ADU28901.1 ABC-1 domain-containing protein [Evansella cellulosilytica DSM 2522]
MGSGRRFRQLQRYRTIATALARNGLGYLFHETGLTEKILSFRSEERKAVKDKSTGERVRLLLEELGTTYIKLGQIASTRPDLLPPDIVKELGRLQDDVPPFSYEEASVIIEQELGEPVESLFKEFSETPLAAASIGQVHYAVLKDGTEVVVKVQRPGIIPQMETDLEIIADWARLAETHFDWARDYGLRDIIDEIGKGMLLELDYRNEARNMERFANKSVNHEYIHIPDVYWNYTTKRILTMDYVEGIRISNLEALDSAGYDRSLLAKRLSETIFHQVLIDGVFHADPHPGNVLALPNGGIALLDFGMVGRLSPEKKKYAVSLIIALRNQNTKGILRAVTNMGIVHPDTNMDQLYLDVDDLREKYYDVPLEQLSLGQAIEDLFTIAFKHQIRIPTELTLLGKSLLTTEGVVVALDPTFSIFDVAEPMGKKLILDRLDPWKKIKSISMDVQDYLDLLNEVPVSLKQFLSILRHGKMKIEIDSPQTDVLMRKMDRISNRLSFSIVLLSLSIIMLGLIIGAALSGTQTILWRLPIIEISFVISILMVVWLFFSIFRSGRF